VSRGGEGRSDNLSRFRNREAEMYAVIQTGGKQYRVAEGDKLDVELLDGDDVTL